MSPMASTAERCDNGLLRMRWRTCSSRRAAASMARSTKVVGRFGPLSESLCIAQIIPLAVSSPILGRIYASVFCSDVCCVRSLSVIPTVRPCAGFVFFYRHCLCRSRPKINGLPASPGWCRCCYQYSRHCHQRRKARSCPGPGLWRPRY